MGHYDDLEKKNIDELLNLAEYQSCKKRQEQLLQAMAEPVYYTDNVNHPKHYTEHPSGVECIQITEHMNFCLGNAIKYLFRHEHKNGIEDLKKAVWYINREIDRLSKEKDDETMG